MEAFKPMRDAHFNSRGYGKFLESLLNMCHYLMGKGFGNLFNPWHLPVRQLITYYKYQKVQDFSRMLEDIQVQKGVLYAINGGKEGVEALEKLEKYLKREDHI